MRPIIFLLLAACNAPPGSPVVAIVPADPLTTDDLEAVIQGSAADPNGDDVSYAYSWFIDGEPTGETGSIIPADLTTKGETWKVVVTPNDGKFDGTAGSDEVIIGNTPPVVSLVIDPLSPTAADSVTATPTTSDVDDDGVTLAWSWARDGSDAGLSEPVLPAGTGVRGESWTVTAIPGDGEGDGEAASVSFTIVNAPPVLEDLVLSPDPASSTDTLTATPINADDIDGDAVSVSVRWLVAGVEVASETIDADSASSISGLFAKHDEITVVATPTDGTDEGAPVESTLVISNSAPSLIGAEILPDPPEAGSTVTCTGIGWADDDDDPEGWATAWTVNGVEVSTTAILPSGTFARGDEIGCTLIPDDGDDQGAPVTATPVIAINAPPTCTGSGITIGPTSPTASDTLYIVTDNRTNCYDPDGDPITQTHDWSVNGVPSVGTESTLAGVFHAGDSVELSSGWSDGMDAGALATSQTLWVVNSLPVIDSLELSPAIATTDTILSAIVSVSDADHHSVNLSYAWTVGGAAVGSTSTLDGATAFSKGQLVELSVTPFDGFDSGTPSTVSTIVANSAPSSPTMAILPAAPADADPLVCTFTAPATDADGDPLTYTFTWLTGGVTYPSAITTTFPGDTVPASATTLGQTWTCMVTAWDGTDPGPAGTAEATVGCDFDGDGYSDVACGGTDCNDADRDIHPGADEICDAADVDEDCDGLSDDADPSLVGSTWYRDSDSDTFGDPNAWVRACTRPGGYISNPDDCDDTASWINPGGYEYCDSQDRDEDCDGLADNADPSAYGQSSLYPDADGDTYGDSSATALVVCSGIAGYVTNRSDCDDADASQSPAATEICNDGIDNDCDNNSFPCGIEGTGTLSEAGATITATSSSFGYDMSTGDFNGDGDADILASWPGNDAVYLYYGPITAPSVDYADADVTWTYPGSGDFGYPAQGLGDINGDGFDDILLYDYDALSSPVFLIQGGPALVDDTLALADHWDTADYSISVSRVGDFDGDGYGDFAIGEPFASRPGIVHLRLGDPSRSYTEVNFTMSYSNTLLGSTVAGGDDLDGDGLDDLVIERDGAYSNSLVFIVPGDTTPNSASLSSYWFSDADAYVETSLPGDVDGDGLPDLAVASDRLYFFLSPPGTGTTSANAWAYATLGSQTTRGNTNDDADDELFVWSTGFAERYELPLSGGALGSCDGRISMSMYSLEVPGDLNGDAFGDVLAASTGFPNGLFIFTGGLW